MGDFGARGGAGKGGRGKGTFSRRFLERGRGEAERETQAWLRPDMPSYEREKMMRRRVVPGFCVSLSPTGAVDRDSPAETARLAPSVNERRGGRARPVPSYVLINLSEALVIPSVYIYIYMYNIRRANVRLRNI